MNLFEKARKLLGKEPKKQVESTGQTTAIPQEWLDAAQAEVGSLLSREEVESARTAELAHNVNVTALREAMLNHLDADALVTLAEQIGLAPSQLFGGKGRKVMGLLQHAERNQRVTELLAACQTLKPAIDWQKEHK